MNDLQVFILIKSIIDNFLVNQGVTGVSVKQNYQPTMQGTPEGPAVFVHSINTNRYGHAIEKNVYNETTELFDQSNEFWRRKSFQVMARVQLNPTDENQITAADLVNMVADSLNMSDTRQTLLSSDIGIERITQVREPYIVNEKERFESEPSFDFTLSYRKIYNSTVRKVDSSELNIKRV